MTQAAILAASGSPGTTTGFKNRIINGNMVLDQRNAGAAVTTSTNYVYPVDRFRVGYGSGGAITAQQSTTVPASGGFTNSLYCTPSITDNLADANDFYGIVQPIEGYNVADLGWGTASAKTVTISFWVRSSVTGTYSVTISNSAGDRCYPATYTISSANTWEYKTLTVVGDTSGTWLTTNGTGMVVAWNLGGGSTYASGTANAWNAAGYKMTSSQTPWISTSGATFYITGVQLEVGTTATNFDFRSYGTELAFCQRYYETSFPVGTAPAVATNPDPINIGAIAYASSAARTPYISYKVVKRTAPTVTLYSPNGYGGFSSNNFAVYSPGNQWYLFSPGSLTTTTFGFYQDSSAGFSFSSANAYLCAGDFAASAEL